MFYSPNSANACTTNLSQTKGLDTLDSSESFENESGIQTGFSLSTSLAMTSDLTSPDVPSINFNSVISKENTSSTIILANDKMENSKLSTFSLDLTESVNHIDQEESVCNQWYY